MSQLLVSKFCSMASSMIKTVTVVGGGIMGSGIAQVTAQAGQNVTILDLNADLLEKSLKSIHTNLGRVAKTKFKKDPAKIDEFVKDAFSRIKTTTNLEEAAGADLIIEAIVEKLGPKQELFNKLDQISPEHTIFASNTSTIPIKEIGAEVKRKDRLGGLHFCNPVPLISLLEVIVTPETSAATHSTMLAWGASVGKTCITCKDTPGFVLNRIIGPYTVEAIRMLERGDASKEDIDTALRLGAGYPMGPLELADLTGLDTNDYGRHVLYSHTGDPVFRPIPLLTRMVAEGKLGVKTGEGFYKYNKL